MTLACGSRLTDLGESHGWYHIQFKGTVAGWVDGPRVANQNTHPSSDCAGAVTYQIGSRVRSHAASGCLNLRIAPSRQAMYAHCVSDGHVFVIISGPIEVSGEDWFRVFSSSTADGFVPAQYLLPG